MSWETLDILFVGDSGVGKSSLLETFNRGLFADVARGVLPEAVLLEGCAGPRAKVNVRLCDTINDMSALRSRIREKAAGIVIVCSWDNPQSVTRAVDHWLAEIAKTWSEPLPLAVVMNKSDCWHSTSSASDLMAASGRLERHPLVGGIHDVSCQFEPTSVFRALNRIVDSVVFPIYPLVVTADDYKYRRLSSRLSAHYECELATATHFDATHKPMSESSSGYLQSAAAAQFDDGILIDDSQSLFSGYYSKDAFSHSSDSKMAKSSDSKKRGGGTVMTEGLLFAIRRIFHVLDSADGRCDSLLTDGDLLSYFSQVLCLVTVRDTAQIAELKQWLSVLDASALRQRNGHEHDMLSAATVTRRTPLCLARRPSAPRRSGIGETDAHSPDSSQFADSDKIDNNDLSNFCVTLYGFTRIHDYLISAGQLVAVWTALEMFGYTRRMRLQPHLRDSLKRPMADASSIGGGSIESPLKGDKDSGVYEMKAEVSRNLLSIFVNYCSNEHCPHDLVSCFMDQWRLPFLLEMFNLASLPFGDYYLRIAGVESREELSLSAWLAMWHLAMHSAPEQVIGLLVYGMGVAPLHVALCPQMSDFITTYKSPSVSSLKKVSSAATSARRKQQHSGRQQEVDGNEGRQQRADNGRYDERQRMFNCLVLCIDDLQPETYNGNSLLPSQFLSSFIYDFANVYALDSSTSSLPKATSSSPHSSAASDAGTGTGLLGFSTRTRGGHPPIRDECIGSVLVPKSSEGNVVDCYTLRMATASAWKRPLPLPQIRDVTSYTGECAAERGRIEGIGGEIDSVENSSGLFAAMQPIGEGKKLDLVQTFSRAVAAFDTVIFLSADKHTASVSVAGERGESAISQQKSKIAATKLFDACMKTGTPLIAVEYSRGNSAEEGLSAMHVGSDGKEVGHLMTALQRRMKKKKSLSVSPLGIECALDWRLQTDVCAIDSQRTFNIALVKLVHYRKGCVPLSVWQKTATVMKPVLIATATIAAVYFAGKWMKGAKPQRRKRKKKRRKSVLRKKSGNAIDGKALVQNGTEMQTASVFTWAVCQVMDILFS